jgi:hypothetical protein
MAGTNIPLNEGFPKKGGLNPPPTDYRPPPPQPLRPANPPPLPPKQSPAVAATATSKGLPESC